MQLKTIGVIIDMQTHKKTMAKEKKTPPVNVKVHKAAHKLLKLLQAHTEERLDDLASKAITEFYEREIKKVNNQ